MQTTKEAQKRLDNLKTQPRMILIYRSLSDVVGFIREKRKNHICIGRESNVRISRNFEFCNEQVPLRAKFLIFFSYNSCNFYYCNNYLTTYFSSLFNNFNNFLEIKKKDTHERKWRIFARLNIRIWVKILSFHGIFNFKNMSRKRHDFFRTNVCKKSPALPFISPFDRHYLSTPSLRFLLLGSKIDDKTVFHANEFRDQGGRKSKAANGVWIESRSRGRKIMSVFFHS